MLAPTIAAITRDPTGGGIAVVADLLWRAARDHWGADAHLLTMFEHEARPATMAEKAKFAVQLASLEMSGATDWVLFSHLALAQVHAMLPARRRPGYGVFLHGIEVWRPLSRKEERALRGADIRLANSRYTADRVMAMHPSIGRVEVCALALDRDGGAAPAAETSLPLGSHAVLIVGRMASGERYKGHDQLIEAWPSIVSRVPDAQLVIVGDGDDRARLQAKANDSAARDHVFFTGFVSEPALQRLYRDAALFALPSRGEGFGLVYLEAMRAGLACVGSVHDAAREVIADSHTGRLVDQGDHAEIAKTIVHLLLHDGERRRMGEAGRARFLREFTFERFSGRLAELLEAVSRERVAS